MVKTHWMLGLDLRKLDLPYPEGSLTLVVWQQFPLRLLNMSESQEMERMAKLVQWSTEYEARKHDSSGMLSRLRN